MSETTQSLSFVDRETGGRLETALLAEVLENCGNNVEKAASFLMEMGYPARVPPRLKTALLAEVLPPSLETALIAEVLENCRNDVEKAASFLVDMGHPAHVPPCSLCKSRSHATSDHKCSVCKGLGHRGRACTAIKTEGLPSRQMHLFHMTSEENCRAIITSGKMLPGSKGMFGAGIYFCDNPADCVGKAHSTGVTLRCLVRVGRSLICERADSTLCMDKVRQRGCTSVKAPGGYAVRRDEYAVFESWQVRHIEVQSYHEGGACMPQAAWPNWALAMSQTAQAYRPPPAPAWDEPTGGRPARPDSATGIPIAKSTGLPDRRFRQGPASRAPSRAPDARPLDPATGIPIAVSTGQPDRRFACHRGHDHSPPRAAFHGSPTRLWNNAVGPLTQAGLPDMRYAANFRASPGGGHASLGGHGGFMGSASHAWNGNTSGPMTRAGRPDMRFKCNRE